ncbi:hypothetical protein GCK72_020783 [Caenorhabditis remanei]|uniref:Uncharacterized protein n=1 Tax=Caenorhabditis remanei TaxID=31234 RepID=A0A6A5GHS8_CAERE|nr:hypothetical protein GCK72_020783 [Caenorhabditis remanei]KAF1754223.1 hypothetical protein GCK72_020783 [Caenorhabditis remanei]
MLTENFHIKGAQIMLFVKSCSSSKYREILGAPALYFLFCLPFCYTAFKKNQHAYSESPFRPLIVFAYRTIMYLYTALFVVIFIAVVIRGVTSFYLSFFLIALLVGPFIILLNWFSASYQLTISIIYIHRVINSHRSLQLRKQLSHRQVQVLTYGIFGLIVLKDFETSRRVAAVSKAGNLDTFETPVMYYKITYIVHQVFVFIAMACQLCIKESASSRSENVIATHTKYIGAIKLGLGIIYAVRPLFEYNEFWASTLFFAIDFFLVPVVIQMTEITNAAPNVITTVPISLPVIDVQKINFDFNLN